MKQESSSTITDSRTELVFLRREEEQMKRYVLKFRIAKNHGETVIAEKTAEEYKNEKNTKKPIDMWIKANIIRYEQEYGETYEMHQANLYNAKKLEKFRNQKMKEHKRNKDGQ